jgi:hypothetical protein
MSKSDYKSHSANRNGLVFAVRRGRKAPVIFKTWNEYKEATKGFPNPMFRKLPRALAERHLEFERDEDAREFAKLHPAQSRNRADHIQDRYSQGSSSSSPTAPSSAPAVGRYDNDVYDGSDGPGGEMTSMRTVMTAAFGNDVYANANANGMQWEGNASSYGAGHMNGATATAGHPHGAAAGHPHGNDIAPWGQFDYGCMQGQMSQLQVELTDKAHCARVEAHATKQVQETRHELRRTVQEAQQSRQCSEDAWKRSRVLEQEHQMCLESIRSNSACMGVEQTKTRDLRCKAAKDDRVIADLQTEINDVVAVAREDKSTRENLKRTTEDRTANLKREVASLETQIEKLQHGI